MFVEEIFPATSPLAHTVADHCQPAVSVARLEELIRSGMILRTQLISEDIYHYSTSALADVRLSPEEWPLEARIAQGLLLTTDYEVVARPPEKIFWWENYFGYIPLFHQPPSLQPMLDGLTCNMYAGRDGTIRFATARAINSDVCQAIQRLYEEKYASLALATPERLQGKTITFVACQNATTHAFDRLILLEASTINNRQLVPLEWPERVVRYTSHDLDTILDSTCHDFIMRTMNGFQLYVSKEQYFQFLRVDEKKLSQTIWRYLHDDDDPTALYDSISPAFHAWMRDETLYMQQQFITKRTAILKEYNEIHADMPTCTPEEFQKDFAMIAKDSPYASYLFDILNRREIDDKLWKDFRPSLRNPRKTLTLPSEERVSKDLVTAGP